MVRPVERVKVIGELHQLLLPVPPEEEDIVNKTPQQVRSGTTKGPEFRT